MGTLYYRPQQNATFKQCQAAGMLCHTMLTRFTLGSFADAVEHVVAHGIAGDVVELGVWRGGGCMYIKALLDVLEGPTSKRSVHLFDVFNMGSLYENSRWDNIFGHLNANSVSSISESFDKLGLLDERVRFHVGLFNNTAKAFRRASDAQSAPASIAVLRIDGNYYQSYEDVMYSLYELVPIGGIVIFDDVYDGVAERWSVMKFWRHFKRDYGLTETMSPKIPGPGGTAWYRKTTPVTIDWSKKRFRQNLRFHNPTPSRS